MKYFKFFILGIFSLSVLLMIAGMLIGIWFNYDDLGLKLIGTGVIFLVISGIIIAEVD